MSDRSVKLLLEDMLDAIQQIDKYTLDVLAALGIRVDLKRPEDGN